VIQHAVWLYLRFTLSYRDVEDLLAERGLDLSYETVRSWVLKFGPVIARRLRRCGPRPSNRWHLDGVSRTRFLKERQAGRSGARPARCRPRHAGTGE
jgi:transposase-like protein